MSIFRYRYAQGTSSFESFEIADQLYSVEYSISGNYYPETREGPAEYPELEISSIKILDDDGKKHDLSSVEYNDIEGEVSSLIWEHEQERGEE